MLAGPESKVRMHPTTLEQTGDRELVITRTFDAPASLVFDAWTRADLVARWWAPKSRGVTLVSCDADVRVGGVYRYVLRTRIGEEIAFSGTYREITRPTRLVYTQIFEPMPGPPAVITLTLAEAEGTTRLTAHEVYPSKAVLNMVLASGMEQGMRETMDQLAELLGSLRQP
jgi:uncharacterized protein YndB with AHSA1/START domain